MRQLPLPMVKLGGPFHVADEQISVDSAIDQIDQFAEKRAAGGELKVEPRLR